MLPFSIIDVQRTLIPESAIANTDTIVKLCSIRFVIDKLLPLNSLAVYDVKAFISISSIISGVPDENALHANCDRITMTKITMQLQIEGITFPITHIK